MINPPRPGDDRLSLVLEAGTLLAKGSELYVPGLSPWI